jgi:hypothetical protein
MKGGHVSSDKDDKAKKESSTPRETPVTTAASGIAAMFIRRSLENGREAKIPSLGIKIEKPKEK